MSPRLKRFPDELGVLTCRCVFDAGESVRFVSHAGGDWQMYSHDSHHDFTDDAAMRRDLVVVHIAHLLVRDSTLNEVADLPVDMGAERPFAGSPWTRFEDRDDESPPGRPSGSGEPRDDRS